MPNYKATALGFIDGSRVKPGQIFSTTEKLDPVPSWAEYVDDKPAPKKRAAKLKTAPAVAEGEEGRAGAKLAPSPTNLEVI